MSNKNERAENMNISTDQIVSISEANQNFSKTARLADKLGEVYIFKNNKPKYKLTVIEDLPEDGQLEEPQAEEVSEKKLLRLIKKYRRSIEELLRRSDKNQNGD